MNNYENAGVGLRKMYVATIGTLVCTLLSGFPLVGVLFSIAILVFYVIHLQGYYHVGKDIAAGKVAFVLQIVSICLSVVKAFEIVPESVEFLLTIADELVPLVAICLVYGSVCKILRAKGADEVAKQGKIALCLQLASGVIVIVSTGMILGGSVLSGALIALIFSIVNLIYTLKFLKKSAEEFGTYF